MLRRQDPSAGLATKLELGLFLIFCCFGIFCYNKHMWQRKIKSSILSKLLELVKSPKTFFFVALLIFIFLAMPLWRNLSERYRISQEIGDLEQQIGKTQSKNLELQKLISYLGSDQFVEEQARENLGLKRAGEKVYIVKGLSNKGLPDQQVGDPIWEVPGLEKAQARANVSNPERWRDYFFKSQ